MPQKECFWKLLMFVRSISRRLFISRNSWEYIAKNCLDMRAMCKYFSQDDDPAGRMLGEVTSMLLTDIVEATWIHRPWREISNWFEIFLWTNKKRNQILPEVDRKGWRRRPAKDSKSTLHNVNKCFVFIDYSRIEISPSEGSKKEVVVIRVLNAKPNI